MPSLGSHLNFNQLEARNAAIHNLSAAPSSPVKGQMYYDTVSNTLMWFDGTAWQSAKGGVTAPPDASTSAKGIVQLANDLGGTAVAPTVVGLHLAADTAINHKLTALTDPTNPQEAATKNYVDGKVGGGGPPVGTAGGDLAGSTYPNPVIANGVVTSAKIADGTITDVDVAAANKDGSSLTAGMRTLGFSAGQAMPGQTRVDSLATQNGLNTSFNVNTQRIINVGDPTGTQDAATKNYVDNAIQGLDAKQSVKAASAGANLTLSGTQTVDGIALVAGDRILVKDQSTASQNGIYVVAAGAWARSTDANAWTEFPGAYTWVEQGVSSNADTGWICTVDQGGTLETTAITWSQFSGSAVIMAGAGLTKAGNVISANPDGATIDTAGAGTSLEVRPGGIGGTQLANGAVDLTTKVTNILPLANGGTGASTAGNARFWLGAAGYYNNNATHGAGTTITIAGATHNLGAKRAIHVQVQDNSTGNVEIPDISVAANGDVTVTYAASVAANSKLVTLVG